LSAHATGISGIETMSLDAVDVDNEAFLREKTRVNV
jgi:hypothetical protein